MYPGLSVRLLVLESDQLKAKAERNLNRMEEDIKAIIKVTEKKIFKCRPDAYSSAVLTHR